MSQSTSLLQHLLLCSLPLLAACSSPAEKPADPATLARVGDVTITAQKLDKALEVLYPPGNPRPDQVERKALERLIDYELFIMGAKARDLEHDFQVQSIVEQKKQELQLDELYRRGVLKSAPQVTREEAREYFERHRIGEERRVGRILLASPAAVSTILARLNTGEDFAAVASEVSEDGETASKGGNLGWMSRLSFKNHLLRRQVFDASVGDVIGPIQEPDGYSLLKIADIRHVPFDSSTAAVEKTMLEQKRAIDTFKFLEDLAERASLRENAESMQLLLTRLSEAGRKMPELKSGEGNQVLLTLDDTQWTLSNFMAAMLSERDQAEIRTMEDLRLYARRLFSLKVLLSRRATELGIDETEKVKKGVEQTLRNALMDRLRQVEVDEQIDPSKEDVRAYYQQHRERFVLNERISIQEILVDSRDQAEGLLAEIEKGKDMDELARRYTQRGPRIRRAGGRVRLLRPDKYGNVGWEAQNAKKGDIVGPVKSAQGYSVFRVLKIIPAYQQNFEEARGRATAHLRQDWVQQKIEELLKRLRAQFKNQTEIYEDHFQIYLQDGKSA